MVCGIWQGDTHFGDYFESPADGRVFELLHYSQEEFQGHVDCGQLEGL